MALTNLVDELGITRLRVSGAGGSSQPVKVTRFDFTHATPDLAAGVTAYTPAAGELLLDATFIGTENFNGTTPLADLGTFVGGSSGGLGFYANANLPADLLVVADTTPVCGSGIAKTGCGQGGLAGIYAASSPLPFVCDGTPILLVASQDGTQGGTAIDSTAGAATLVIITQPPA